MVGPRAGDYGEARALFEESLDIYRETDDPAASAGRS